jgi:hypothetical protein
MSEQNKDADRAAFEAQYAEDHFGGDVNAIAIHMRRGDDGEYVLRTQRDAWYGWQARSLPVGVPDGYALVPVEPTRTMLHRAYDNNLMSWISRQSTGHDCAAGIWESMLAAAPTGKAEQVQCLPQEWWQIIHDTLRNYRLTTLVDQDGDGYPLIDAMTAEGQPVSDGINECDYLTDAIWNALTAQAPSLPAAGSAAEEVEVVAHFQVPTGGSYAGERFTRIGPVPEIPAANRTYEPLMTVAQHERIVAALSAQQPDHPEEG